MAIVQKDKLNCLEVSNLWQVNIWLVLWSQQLQWSLIVEVENWAIAYLVCSLVYCLAHPPPLISLACLNVCNVLKEKQLSKFDMQDCKYQELVLPDMQELGRVWLTLFNSWYSALQFFLTKFFNNCSVFLQSPVPDVMFTGPSDFVTKLDLCISSASWSHLPLVKIK